MLYKTAYIWSLAGRLLPQAIYFITTMILARFLSPEDFGIIGILSIFLMVANTLLDSGFGGSLINEKNLTEEDCSTIFAFNLGMSIILYILMFCLADSIESYYEIAGLAIITQILCLIIFIQAFSLVPLVLLTKELKFQVITKIRVLSVICASIISIILAIYKFGVYSLVAYQLIQVFCISLLSNYYNHVKLRFLFSKESFKKLFSFGAYTTLANCIDTIYENILTSIFGKYYNVQETGYLAQSKRIEEVATTSIVQTINSTSFPILSKLKNDRISFVKETKAIFATVCLLITPPILMLSLFSEQIIILIFGKSWINAAPYLTLLCYASIFIVMDNLIRNNIKSLGQVSLLFKATILKRLIGISIILLSLTFGASAVLPAFVVCSFIGFIVNQITYSRILKTVVIRDIFYAFTILSPSIIIFLCSIFICSLFNNIFIQLSIISLLLLIYYVCVLKYLGINISKYLSFIKK